MTPIFSLICALTNGWVNNQDAGDYDVIIMPQKCKVDYNRCYAYPFKILVWAFCDFFLAYKCTFTYTSHIHSSTGIECAMLPLFAIHKHTRLPKMSHCIANRERNCHFAYNKRTQVTHLLSVQAARDTNTVWTISHYFACSSTLIG